MKFNALKKNIILLYFGSGSRDLCDFFFTTLNHFFFFFFFFFFLKYTGGLF